MAHCHNCGGELQRGMKFCPHCGQDQAVVVPQDERIPTEDVPVPPPPSGPLFEPQQGGSRQGSGMSRKWWIGLLGFGGLGLLLLLAVLVVAIVSGSSDETAQSGGGEEKSKDKKSTSNNKKGGSGSATVAVGEPAELDDQTFTVIEVERNYAPSNRFSKAESGNEYLRVLVMLTNTSNRNLDYNPFNFEVQDSNGVQKNTTFMSEVPNNLESGSLAPEGRVEGNLVFEVPRNDNNLKLIYTLNMFSGETVTVEPLQ